MTARGLLGIAAGREFVNAYVEFMHYVERLHTDAAGPAGHHAESVNPDDHGTHQH